MKTIQEQIQDIQTQADILAKETTATETKKNTVVANEDNLAIMFALAELDEKLNLILDKVGA